MLIYVYTSYPQRRIEHFTKLQKLLDLKIKENFNFVDDNVDKINSINNIIHTNVG